MTVANSIAFILLRYSLFNNQAIFMLFMGASRETPVP
jgi:hypothetical protein